MSRIYLLELKPERVEQYWRALEPELARACAYSADLLTPEIVKAKALAREYQIWTAFTDEPRQLKAVAVTTLAPMPNGEVIAELVLVAGHERQSWLLFNDEMAAWARANGCKRVWCRGRDGWRRSLPEGWRSVGTIYELQIDHEDAKKEAAA